MRYKTVQAVTDAFFRKVRLSRSGCWVWIGDKAPFGYGYVTTREYNGARRSRVKSHRLSWSLFRGPIPDGLCVLHHCDNPPCVNPEHLFLGTRKDNQRDMVAKGRHARKGARGSANTWAKLSEPEVVEIAALVRSGERRKVIAERFGVSTSLIHLIAHRRIWKHL